MAAFTAGEMVDVRRAFAGLAAVLLAIAVGEPGDLIVLGPLFAGAWFLGRLAETRRPQAEQLAERATALEHEGSEHARLAIAEERARIARELHDVVAHSVSVMVVQAVAERLALGAERPETREVLGAIESTDRHAMVEMRRLVGMLRAEDEQIALAPLPSLDHLEALAAHVSAAGLPVEVEVSEARRHMPPGLDVSGYPIVQEALTNALKHAGLDEHVFAALRAGASGFLLKDVPPEDLIRGAHTVAGGDALLAPAVTRSVVERFTRLPEASAELRARLDELTRREAEVLLLMARGRSNQEIAEALVVSEGTVKTHVLRKLGLRDRVQAVIFGYEAGLTRVGEAGLERRGA